MRDQPEDWNLGTWGPKREILFSCTLCEACVQVCPTGAITLGVRTFVIDMDRCDGHGICEKICPVSAIRLRVAQEPTIP
jgi:ferredoxin